MALSPLSACSRCSNLIRSNNAARLEGIEKGIGLARRCHGETLRAIAAQTGKQGGINHVRMSGLIALMFVAGFTSPSVARDTLCSRFKRQMAESLVVTNRCEVKSQWSVK